MPEPLPFDPDEAARRLLAWYAVQGRDLPWRRTRDPYAVWLSEVMLQQTGVETVIPYYRRFLEAYPTVTALAAAPLEEVIEAWAGLGYYRRARNLHAAAGMVSRELEGRFPDTLEGLQALPGVGRSTAAAILSIAYDRPAAILDGNVRRVLCRLFALHGDSRSAQAERALWGWAEALTSRERPHDYAQAIMDLGATLCTPRHPTCPECPWCHFCQGYRDGIAEQLPESPPRKALLQRRQVALLLEHAGRVLVCRRGLEGMLGGLWEFPCREVADDEAGPAVISRLAVELGGGTPRALGKVRHLYSHFRLEVELYGAHLDGATRVAEAEGCRWLPDAELGQLALHGAHLKALKLIDLSKETS